MDGFGGFGRIAICEMRSWRSLAWTERRHFLPSPRLSKVDIESFHFPIKVCVFSHKADRI